MFAEALEMFVSIITSGHLSETAITSLVKGSGAFPISEYNVLKILMRTDYRFFSEDSGFTTNLFYYNQDWEKPDNFILVELLYWLARNRRRIGQIGLEGFFSCRHIGEEMQRQGYVPEDILSALNFLLTKELIEADHMNFTHVDFDDAVRIEAWDLFTFGFLRSVWSICTGLLGRRRSVRRLPQSCLQSF